MVGGSKECLRKCEIRMKDINRNGKDECGTNRKEGRSE